MARSLSIIGFLALAIGLLWIGQGTGVIPWPPSSFMINQLQWAGYGAVLAAVTYSKPADDPSLLISGIGRAEAMAYRDARGQAMTDLDWSEIECRLRRAYRSLKAAVGAGNS